MGVTLNEILTLAGRLDDASGFDAPRERFRRFLLEHVRQPQSARSLIEQARHAPGEQHHRALQDLVLLLGSFLGFDVSFGSYQPAADGSHHHGSWRSRTRLQVLVDVRMEQPSDADVETFLRQVSGPSVRGSLPGSRRAGIGVLVPVHANRDKVVHAVRTAAAAVPVLVTPLGTLLSLAELAAGGRLTHEEIVRLIESNIPLDFVVALLERPVDTAAAEAAASGATASIATPASDEPVEWLATVVPDQGTTPEQFLDAVVARRQLFGITGDVAERGGARQGDRICFHIPGKGVVGHARIRALLDSGSGMRDAHRFKQVLQLEDLTLHLATPIALDPETQIRLRAAQATGHRQAQTLMRISAASYAALTSPRPNEPQEKPAGKGNPGPAVAAAAVSAASPHLPG